MSKNRPMNAMTVAAEAVIFDMDGVITDTMPLHSAAWQYAFALEGLSVPEEVIYLHEGQKGSIFLKEYLPSRGMAYDSGFARRVLRKKEERFKQIAWPKLFPGVRTVLKTLARKMPIALVTGTSRDEIPGMLPDTIRSLFKVVVTGSDVSRGKPDPLPYRRALRLLKIKAASALAVENAPLGIRSAKDAGLRCFAIQSYLPGKHLKQADRIFSSLVEMHKRVTFQTNGQC